MIAIKIERSVACYTVTMELKKFYLFSTLSEEQIAQLQQLASLRHREAGTILFMAGERPRHLLLLQKGRVRVYRHDDRGTEVTLHRFGPGDLIAEMPALEKLPYPATAVCESSVELIVIALEPFEQMLSDSSALAGAIVRSLCKKIRHLEQALGRTTGGDATTRVATLLRDSPDLFASLRQHEVASSLGMTPETLSRVLGKLRSSGVITKRQGRYVVCDQKALAALAP